MIKLTVVAKEKLQEMFTADEKPTMLLGIRFAVLGGGCSGFSYHMAWWRQGETLPEHLRDNDHVYDLDDHELDYAQFGRSTPNSPGELKVFIDQMSAMYLEGTIVDYRETLQGSGFVFNNPNVKSTCGCGSSFST